MAGYEVRTAADAREAMLCLKSEDFDAVLSDVTMPRMNGHDLARWIAREYPRIPTALMSGYDPGCEECPISGRCRRLAKPFRPSEAVALIGQVLAKQPAA